MEKWYITTKKADFDALARKYKIDPVIARLIRNRNVITEEEYDLYLNGTLDSLHSPWLMKDMEKAVNMIQNKIKERKKIRIIGDYDIDGVNATYLLLQGINRCGGIVDTDIPDRMKDGYGINETLIKRALEDEIDTIITCDNGIAALNEIQFAKANNLTVIVTDHHDIPYEETEDKTLRYLSSEADAIINPKQNDCPYPFKHLCGAAVAYKFVQALYEKEDVPVEECHSLITYAAIATVGDVMDLIGENRIFVKEGLKRIRNTKNAGLSALIRCNQLNPEKISAYHIGFVIGPCINAGGRLDNAKRALALLCAETNEEADRLAGDLKALNDSRKNMTTEGVEQAIKQLESSSLKEDKVLLIYLPDCHESLAGIIAGRIREKYHKPVLVFTNAEEGAKGSGRSIESYNMFEELSKHKTLYHKFGGHPMAAGLSLPIENIEILRKYLNNATSLTEEDFIPKISIDVPMPVDYVTEPLISELSLLEPFGKANPKPLFAEKEVSFLQAKVLGKNRNVVKFVIKNRAGCLREAIYFGDIVSFEQFLIEKFGEEEKERLYAGVENKIQLSITYYPDINEFNGKKTIQIIIQNYC